MAFVAITLVACSSDDEKKNTRLLTFHIANDRGISPGLTRKVVTMPFSGFTVMMNEDQFMYTGDLAKIDLAQITLIDGPIVVLYGGEPIALRKIDTTISDGSLFAHIEIPKDKDVGKFYNELAKSIETVEEIKKEEGSTLTW